MKKKLKILPGVFFYLFLLIQRLFSNKKQIQKKPQKHLKLCVKIQLSINHYALNTTLQLFPEKSFCQV